MKKELDQALVERFPKMYKERYSDPRCTAMCYGFSHNDGWYKIIENLSNCIQHHVDNSRRRRLSALRYNRGLAQALKGNHYGLVSYYAFGGAVNDWTMQRVEDAVKENKPMPVPEACPQVVVKQVKEKFGTLRFYYDGGDDTVYGMVRLAESMSACTCETCGKPGVARSGGWIQTLCDEHAEGREQLNWNEMP